MVRVIVTDKWDIDRCRRCELLGSISEGAKNIRGEWMTPEGFWFTVECRAPTHLCPYVQRSRRRRP